MEVSTNFLLVTFAIAILAVIFMWYFTKSYRQIPDDTQLELSGTDDKILNSWYKSQRKNIEPIDESSFASKLLLELYDINSDPDDVVIGTKIEGPLKEIYYTRSDIGKSFMIGTVEPRRKHRVKIFKSETFDEDIIDVQCALPLIKEVKSTLNDILEKRWTQLDLELSLVPNDDASYLYIQDSIPNVKDKKGRVNLLCSDLEFKTLISRIRKIETSASTV